MNQASAIRGVFVAAGVFRRRAVLVAALASSLMPITGCMSYEPARLASEATPSHVVHPEPLVSSSDWPARYRVWSGLPRAVPGGLSRRLMGTIVPLEGPPRMFRKTDADRVLLNEEQREDANTLARRRAPWFSDGLARFEGEGPGAFVFVSPSISRGIKPGDARGASLFFKFISGTERGRQPAVSTPTGDVMPGGVLVDLQRTWFSYADADVGTPARGLIVLLPGLFGTPEPTIDAIAGSLRAEGWCVLRMLAQPSRFSERREFRIDPTDPAQGIAAVSAVLGDRAVECAYAVEAALVYVMSQRPALADRPRVVMGLSAGAMVLPTVVARQPEAFDAAVLIAGGVDYMSIALRSGYAGWVDALRFVWLGAAPTAEQRREAIALYRSTSPLDPVRTAAVLRALPTLMIHARSDTAVPSDLGDELWELAGRPERWTFAGGHEWLFIFLPGYTDRMISWLRDAAGERRSAGRVTAPARPLLPIGGAQ